MFRLFVLFFIITTYLPFIIIGNWSIEKFFLILNLSIPLLYFFLHKIYKKNNKYQMIVLIGNGYVFFFCILIYIFFKLDYILESVTALLDGNLSELMLKRASERYEGIVSPDIVRHNFATIFFLYSCSIAPLLYNKYFKKYIYFSLLFLFIVESMSLARAGALLGLVNFITMYLFNNRVYYNRFSFFEIINKFKYLLLTVIGLFFFSLFKRLSSNDGIDVVYHKISVYIFAHYSAFYKWFEYSDVSPKYGSMSFASLLKIFGKSYPQGFYSFVNTEFGDTNIYTVYRNIFEDFYVFSPFIIFTLIYFISKIDRKLIDIFTILGILSFKFLVFYFNSPYVFTTFLIADFLLLLSFLLFKKRVLI